MFHEDKSRHDLKRFMNRPPMMFFRPNKQLEGQIGAAEPQSHIQPPRLLFTLQGEDPSYVYLYPSLLHMVNIGSRK